jgi:hypothetical protein
MVTPDIFTPSVCDTVGAGAKGVLFAPALMIKRTPPKCLMHRHPALVCVLDKMQIVVHVSKDPCLIGAEFLFDANHGTSH